MLVASRRIELFERYRIPYSVDETISGGVLRIRRADGDGGEVLSLGATPANGGARAHRVDGALLYAALAEPSAFATRLPGEREAWTPERDIVDPGGVVRASILRAADGSIAFPFDIDEPFDNLLQESYVSTGTSAIRSLAQRGYYRARPLLPYSLQMALRRSFRRVQERSDFPAWPIETSFHRLEALVLSLVESAIGEPLPWIAPWPAPYSWAVVLTHDIERIGGYRHLPEVLAVEERCGFHAAWYFVPERDYTVEDSLLDMLREHGCEIGLHGLRHDGRDLSPGTFEERLPAMRSYLERWGARGFRGPSTHRDHRMLSRLGVDHDSSWSDSARYEPQPGGTGSWLPFFIGDVVELPITLPMDHTLFELKQLTGAEAWIEKTAFLREQGGMALMVTHPDYLVDEERLMAYESFLSAQADETTAWRALPREVAAWWRRRAESRIEQIDGEWMPVGPAATEAAVRVGVPSPAPSPNELVSRVAS
jgi:peptidoglycan/xylan/chitin deacetylase (PgdA/CDA1 family)